MNVVDVTDWRRSLKFIESLTNDDASEKFRRDLYCVSQIYWQFLPSDKDNESHLLLIFCMIDGILKRWSFSDGGWDRRGGVPMFGDISFFSDKQSRSMINWKSIWKIFNR